jgi:uncharacterized membrane protein YebE (DUF533 family)
VNDLDIEGLLGSVLRGALGGGRKRKRGALSYLAGGRSSFLNASTLLTVAGVAWGLWESAQASSAAPVTTPAPGAPPAQGLAVPPPIPGSATAGTGVPLTTPPPVPGTAAPSGAPAVPPDVLRVLRLTLAAARADGTLEPRERDAILTRARELGAEPLIAAEFDAPRPIAEIVGGVSDPQTRQDLYTLAFAVVRADETLTDGERTWLTALAGQLGLDATTVEKLEQHAASRITAAAEGAQH